MNSYRYIASRINQASYNEQSSFSSFIAKVAIISTAASLACIILAFNILIGFKSAVKDKIFSISGHIQISKYDWNHSMENSPLLTDSLLIKPGFLPHWVEHTHIYAQKAGVLKADQDVMGIIFKGYQKETFDNTLKQHLIEGRPIRFSDERYQKEVWLSKWMMDQLQMRLNDTLTIAFIQDPPRVRKLKIVGIYETGMDFFDQHLIFGDIRLIQSINGWDAHTVGGYEIFIRDYDQIDSVSKKIDQMVAYDTQVNKVSDHYVDIFDWLHLLDNNVIVFLTLIIFVACFNMVSIIMIMMMERIPMIGLLKAFGADNAQIRKIFLYKGGILVIKGLAWGNLIGVGLSVIQYYYHIIPLDPQNYYMRYVPIQLDFFTLISVNISIFLLIMISLMIPTHIISKTSPIKAIKFD